MTMGASYLFRELKRDDLEHFMVLEGDMYLDVRVTLFPPDISFFGKSNRIDDPIFQTLSNLLRLPATWDRSKKAPCKGTNLPNVMQLFLTNHLVADVHTAS